MDKRFKPLTPIQQMQKRLSVLETVSNNPDWPFHQVARFIRTELHLTLNDMAKITKIAISLSVRCNSVRMKRAT